MNKKKLLKKGIFVIGTDTGVGKTVVSGLLGRFLLSRDIDAIVQKWVQTGSKNYPQDLKAALKTMKVKRKDLGNNIHKLNSYNLKLASSPHLAAVVEKKRLRPDKIINDFKLIKKKYDFIIAETAGGALVPFNQNTLIIDIAKQLKLPALIVSANKLGAINHTLLTIEAVRRREMEIAGIIFNNLTNGENKLIKKDNIKIIKKIAKVKILGSLAYSKSEENLYGSFLPIGKKFLSVLCNKSVANKNVALGG